MPAPLTRFGGVLDALTFLKDAGLVAASAAGTVLTVAAQWDTGATLPSGAAAPSTWACAIVDVSAVEVDTGNERYTIVIEGCNTSGFGSGQIQPLAVLALGDGTVIVGAGSTDSVVGRYLVPFCNESPVGTTYRYVRVYCEVAGTIATGINYTCYLTPITC